MQLNFLNRLFQFLKYSKNDGHGIADFIKHLHKVFNKEPGKDINTRFRLEYAGKCLDIEFVLVKEATVIDRGIRPYINFLKYLSKDGVDLVYVLAKGKSNISIARHIIENVEKSTSFKNYSEYPPQDESGGEPGYKKCFSLKKSSSNIQPEPARDL